MNNKNNFLSKLSESLYFFSDKERAQVIADYQELITERNSDGEEIEAIIESLDAPEEIAKNYASELGIKYSKVNKYIANTQSKSKNQFNKFKNRNHDKSKVTKLSDAIIYCLITIGLIIKSLFKLCIKIFLYLVLMVLIIGTILFLLLFHFEAYNALIKALVTIGLMSGISINIITIGQLNKFLGRAK